MPLRSRWLPKLRPRMPRWRRAPEAREAEVASEIEMRAAGIQESEATSNTGSGPLSREKKRAELKPPIEPTPPAAKSTKKAAGEARHQRSACGESRRRRGAAQAHT